MKKAISIFSLLAIAFELLYGIVGSASAAIVTLVIQKEQLDMTGFAMGAAYSLVPVIASAIFIAIIAIIMILSNNKGSKLIIAEIIGLIYVSGLFIPVIYLLQSIASRFISDALTASGNRVIAFSAFTNFFSNYAFLGTIASSLLVIACTLSIVNKKRRVQVLPIEEKEKEEKEEKEENDNQ